MKKVEQDATPTEKTKAPAEISELQIQDWKREHGNLFKTTINGEAFIWRKLRRKEYVQIMSAIPEAEEGEVISGRIYQRQEMITRAVVLHPENITDLIEEEAGVATSIADEVILRSGFNLIATEEI